MSASIKLSILVVFTFSLAVVFVCLPQVVKADNNPNLSSAVKLEEPECWPLDVVILIDESLSVSKPDGNDPEGYRFLATEQILSVLISNRRFQCPEAVHRLGVIAFGNYTRTALALDPIDIIDTDDRDAWSQPLKDKINEIKEYPTQQATYPALAFEGADELLSQAPRLPAPPGYGPRQQVVILLTDGNPQRIDAEDAEWRANYLRQLSNSLDSPSWQSRHIWIVALNASSGPYLKKSAFDDLSVGDVWRNIAESHAGQLVDMEYNAQALATTLDTIIVTEFGQPGMPIQCGDFYIDPYLESVRLLFSKRLEREGQPVILQKLDDATGEKLCEFVNGTTTCYGDAEAMVLQSKRYHQDGPVEEYTIDFPLPGRWAFTIEGVDEETCRSIVDATQTPRSGLKMILAEGNVVMYAPDAPYYDQEAVSTLGVSVTLNNLPFEELPVYPVTLEGVVVRLPSGQTKLPDDNDYPPFELTAAAPGIWRSTQPILAPEEGTYGVQLAARSVHSMPLTAYSIFTQTLTFEARRLEKLRFEIELPVDGTVLPCNTVDAAQKTSSGNPLPVRIRLLDSTDQAAAAGYYLSSDPEQAFEARLLNANGNPVGESFYLTASAVETGIFEGSWAPPPDGSVIGCGTVELEVAFRGAVDAQKYILPRKIMSVALTRVEATGVLVSVSKPDAGARFLLHPNFWAARNANVVQPVDLEFTLTDLTGVPLSPAEIARQSPETLYVAQLAGPTNESELLTLTLNTNVLGARGGLTMTQAGAYKFEISANLAAFKDNYIPADSGIITVPLERYDTLATNPTTFKIVSWTSGILTAFTIAAIIFLRTGAPRGTLELVALGGDNVAGPWGLSRRGRYPRIKDKKLLDQGIKVIRARRAKSLSGGHRAVRVIVKDTNNFEIVDIVLEVDEPVPVGETEIVFS